MKKVGKIVGDVLIVLVLIFSILMTVVVISSSKSDSTLPNLFGKAIFNVETDSMLSEQGFDAGSLIIVDLVDHAEDKNKVYKVGDVVTFWRYYENQKYLETHRIVEDTYSNAAEVKNGVWIHGDTPYYVTKGDNTPDIDRQQITLEVDYLTNDNVVAVWTGKAIPHLGSVMSFLQSQLGFMLCVVIPTAVFFLFELFKFITVLMENKKEKALEAVKNAEDEIKQKVIAEMLSKQGVVLDSDDEEEIKKKAVEEYLANKKAEEEYLAKKQAAAKKEELKKKAVEEYLAKQAENKSDDETTD